MRIYPAVDILGGKLVRLVGGNPEKRSFEHDDPVGFARAWVERGARRLHVIDLGAALGLGENRDLIRRIVEGSEVPIQVGGGVRDMKDIDALIGLGATTVIVGTPAFTIDGFLEEATTRHPGRLVLAVDEMGGEVVIKGWQEGSGWSLQTAFSRFNGLPLAAYLHTDVSVEGRTEGLRREWITSVREMAGHPVIVSGGVTSPEDVVNLDTDGAYGAVIGSAFYLGKLLFSDTAPYDE